MIVQTKLGGLIPPTDRPVEEWSKEQMQAIVERYQGTPKRLTLEHDLRADLNELAHAVSTVTGTLPAWTVSIDGRIILHSRDTQPPAPVGRVVASVDDYEDDYEDDEELFDEEC